MAPPEFLLEHGEDIGDGRGVRRPRGCKAPRAALAPGTASIAHPRQPDHQHARTIVRRPEDHPTSGNVNDCTQFEAVMDRIRIARPGPGRPRTGPNVSSRTRATLRGRSAPTCGDEASPAPSRSGSNRSTDASAAARTSAGSTRPPASDATSSNAASADSNRNRALATLSDKRAAHYQAMVTLACLRLWLP